MKYISTRDKNKTAYSAADVIKKGLADDRGLFLPEKFIPVSYDFIEELVPLDYSVRAEKIFSLYLDGYSNDTLRKSCEAAYAGGQFENNDPAPVKKIDASTFFLELWHGPTCAFKDLALQIMPKLLSLSLDITKEDKDALILVATSGDTGKAALEGYKNNDRLKIAVFYPSDGVSTVQKLQMATQEGGNVYVCAVEGNFDDCQTGVKNIFTDPETGKLLAGKNVFLSSANSINWGRLIPQVVYYFSAYAKLLACGEIKTGEYINVTVPTGNFGNILAAYIAKTMGLPLKKLICASNMNNILADFITTGIYDRNRQFYSTISPSMDILISSNLERLIYILGGAEININCMRSLESAGRYEIPASVREGLQSHFRAYFCSEDNTKRTIRNTFEKYNYLIDTHTAVGKYCSDLYKEETGDGAKMLVVSTASPYKFATDVYKSLYCGELSDFEAMRRLEEKTGVKIPGPLSGLQNKTVRFKAICKKEDMKQYVLGLNL